ncbi:MAG: hypothetical protein ACTS46_01500 [Candidatus Hodgkinia cicadicola]
MEFMPSQYIRLCHNVDYVTCTVLQRRPAPMTGHKLITRSVNVFNKYIV